MIIAFDLHNVRDGGGVNYIRNLLHHAAPEIDGFEQVHLIGAPRVLANFPDRPWIAKHGFAELDRGLLRRVLFVRRKLPALLEGIGADLLYAPGGLLVTSFSPAVTISRNMMPFRPEFWSLYPFFSADRMRLRILRRLNALSFQRAEGVIFLSQTARSVIERYIGHPLPRSTVIPHGVDHHRFRPSKRSRGATRGSGQVQIVYPSRLEPYKHQVEVVEAVEKLAEQLPALSVRLCGPANPHYRETLDEALARRPATAARIEYLGEIPNEDLPRLYSESDLLLFASSCENLPNILIEAMASGIPICCSDRSPMPEVARDGCLYFDPTDPESIAAAILATVSDWDAAEQRAQRALAHAAEFEWSKTTRRTFSALLAACTIN